MFVWLLLLLLLLLFWDQELHSAQLDMWLSFC